jgi:hypothetical protein
MVGSEEQGFGLSLCFSSSLKLRSLWSSRNSENLAAECQKTYALVANMIIKYKPPAILALRRNDVSAIWSRHLGSKCRLNTSGPHRD